MPYNFNHIAYVINLKLRTILRIKKILILTPRPKSTKEKAVLIRQHCKFVPPDTTLFQNKRLQF